MVLGRSDRLENHSTVRGRRPDGMSRRLSAVFAFSSALTLSYPAAAQVLSNELVRLTDFGCAGLGATSDGEGGPDPGLGPQLGSICAFVPQGPGSGGGTNSASGGSVGGGVRSEAAADAVRRRLRE